MKISKEEKKWMKERSIGLTSLSTQTAPVYRIDYLLRNYTENFITVNANSFFNCQTLCIGNAYKLLSLPDFVFERTLALILRLCAKRQYLVDVNIQFKDDIIRRFKEFVRAKEQILEYTSTSVF